MWIAVDQDRLAASGGSSVGAFPTHRQAAQVEYARPAPAL